MPDGTPEADPRLAELLSLSEGDRQALVDTIASRGFEPGCWLDITDGDLVTDPALLRWTLDRVAALGALPPVVEGDDPAPKLPWNPPADEAEGGWVILTQTCDLNRDIRDEPFVQVAALRRAGDDVDLASLAANSARAIPLDPTGKSGRWYVDLRIQAFLPKHLLADHAVRHAIPTDEEFGKRRTRSRFALRVGRRFSRAAIPTALVTNLVMPLSQVVTRGALAARTDAAFSEWLLVRQAVGTPVRIVAITRHAGSSAQFRDAEDLFFTEVLPAVPSSARGLIDEDRSEVVALEQALLVDWLDAWALDFGGLTYGRRGDPESAEPLG